MSFGFGGAPQSQSLFGAPASSQSLFGAPASSQSLFGAAPASQSLFGAAPASQSLFGAAPASQSLFGAAPASQSLFGAAPASQSLFGAAPASQSLFGAAPASQSLFGAAPASQSLFGAAPASQSLFGASQPLFASSQSLFASSQSLFAAPQSAPSLFPQQQQQPLQQAQQPPGPPQLPRPLTTLIERLNPLHPESSFNAALYNLVQPSEIGRYTRPQNMDAALWDEAQANNPDPSRLVPVQANLFDDLLQRAEVQSTRIKSHAAVLTRVESELATMHDGLSTDVTPKLAAYRRRHRELARKLLRVACRVEAAASAGALIPSEADRKRRLKAILSALNAPAEFKDKLADLVELADASVVGRGTPPPVEIRDARAAAVIRNLLADQLNGIQQLSGVCDRADRDIYIVEEAVQPR